MNRTLIGVLATTALALLLASAGCGKKGSGVKKEEVREVGAFTAVSIEGAMRLNVVIGPAQKVVISGDDNIVPDVVTKVDGDKLVIETEGSYRTELPLTATVTVPKLTALEISGASKGNVKGITGDNFSVEVSGAAKVTLAGTVNKLAVEVSGAAKIEAAGLKAHDVAVESSGASKIETHAERSLTAKVSGAGSVRYKGSPTVTKDVSGAASIKAL